MRLPLIPMILAACASAVAPGCQQAGASTVATAAERPAADTIHRRLLKPVMSKLPVGSTRPEGWLGEQLRLQRDGLNGHLGEISSWLDKNNNAWLTEHGDRGWEEVPYWLRGYSSVAYILDDRDMIDEARTWFEAVLASRREDGRFGPAANPGDRQEIWAHMVMLWCLQGYYEHTGDPRVLELMRGFFRWEMAQPDEVFLRDYWENSRGGDNMWSVMWYHDITGDDSVLPLIDKLHRCSADFTRRDALPNWHNVNIAQGFREPAEYYLATGDSAMLRASYNVHRLVRRAFGQVPGGMFGADENARIGYTDPRQGTETCGMVEQMLSDGLMLSITGDPMWAEHCEDVAFNSFPASMTSDMKALRYITSPNHTVSDSRNHNPSIDNSGPFLTMNPFSSRCCQHNHGLGWPTLSQYLILSTRDGGLATGVYAANTTDATVAGGVKAKIRENTEYPFSETVSFSMELEKDAAFPFYLRIPSWTSDAVVKVNGKKVSGAVPGQYLRIERAWSDGDRVEATFPMSLSMRRWTANGNSVSVDYGPLTLSLRIGEDYRKVDSRESSIGDSRWQEGADADKWPSYEIYPASAWNYALALSPGRNPLEGIELVRHPYPADNRPFTLEGTPVEFKAKGRLVPSWGYDKTGMCDVLPDEDAPRGSLDDITLVPMGAARLRVSAFPPATR